MDIHQSPYEPLNHSSSQPTRKVPNLKSLKEMIKKNASGTSP